ASAKTTLGLFPPSSRATRLTVPAAAAITRRPLTSPPVNETMSTRGSSASGAPTWAPSPSTRFAAPGGGPAPSSSRITRRAAEGGGGGGVGGVEEEGVAGKQGGGDLPGGLQQGVVPRGDQPADADRLVHDPADRVRASGVAPPTGVGAGDPAVVAEAGHDVV